MKRILGFRWIIISLAVLLLAACGPTDFVPGSGVTVQWETATEVNTVGFNLYRANSKAGPYVKVNTTLIPASGSQLTGSSYKYEDTGVQPGQVYYYQLEDIESSGKATRQEPIAVTVASALEPITAAIILVAVAVLMLGGGFVWLRMRQKSDIVKMTHETT